MNDRLHDRESVEDRVEEAFAHEEPVIDLSTVIDRAARYADLISRTEIKTNLRAASSESGGTVTVAVADHHQEFAEGLGAVLATEVDIRILSVSHNAQEALDLVARHQPTVLVLGPHLTSTDLGTVLGKVHHDASPTNVLMLSTIPRPRIGESLTREDIQHFLSKVHIRSRISSAIRALAETPAAKATMVLPLQYTLFPYAEQRVRLLTNREWQILDFLRRGFSNQRIAKECFLSLHTVRMHIQVILGKLGVHSKLEAVAMTWGIERELDHVHEDADQMRLFPPTVVRGPSS